VTLGWAVFLASVGTFRLSRLVTSDFIMEPFRAWAENRWGEGSKRAYLVGCNWCLSMWLALPVAIVAVLWWDNRVVAIGLVSLAASALTGAFATLLDYLESFTQLNDHIREQDGGGE
jgi:hypothetical protein